MFKNVKYFLNALQRGASVRKAFELTQKNKDINLSLEEFKTQVVELIRLQSEGKLDTFEGQVGITITNNKALEVEGGLREQAENLQGLRK